MSDVVPYSPLHLQPRRRLFLGGVADALGSAAKATGNFVKENPRLVGTLAGAAAAPFTGGMSLQAGMALGSAAGRAADQIEGVGRTKEDRAVQMMRRRRRSAVPTGFGGTSGRYAARGGALKVKGRSHEEGGIRMPGNVEIEGGETLGRVGGKPHAFSKRLKVPGTDMTFADMHRQLVTRGANRSRINRLANLQSQVAGRGDRLEKGGQYGEGGYYATKEEMSVKAYGGDATKRKRRQAGGALHNIPGNRGTNLSRHNLSDETLETATPATVSTSSPEGLPLMGSGSSIVPPNLRASPPSTLMSILHDPETVESAPLEDLTGDFNSSFSLTGPGGVPLGDNEEIQSPSIASPEGGDEGGFSAGSTIDKALPFLPGAINAARGIFGDAEGISIPRVNIPNRSVDAARNMDTDFNVEPQIAAADQAFRSIVANPNMSSAQKQAAFSKLLQNRSQIRAQEENKETQLENRSQELVSRLMAQNDRLEAESNQRAATAEAKSQQQAEATKQNLLSAGISQIVGARSRQKARDTGMNRSIMSVLAATAGAPDSARRSVIESILPLIQNERIRTALQGSISDN